MRYYLAIEAFLGAESAPPQERLEKRLRAWFAAIERYPRQLHEMERGEYLVMKRREYLRHSPNAKRRRPDRPAGIERPSPRPSPPFPGARENPSRLGGRGLAGARRAGPAEEVG